MCKVVVRPAVETVALRNRQKAGLEVTEKKKKNQRGQMVWICPEEEFGIDG